MIKHNQNIIKQTRRCPKEATPSSFCRRNSAGKVGQHDDADRPHFNARDTRYDFPWFELKGGEFAPIIIITRIHLKYEAIAQNHHVLPAVRRRGANGMPTSSEPTNGKPTHRGIRPKSSPFFVCPCDCICCTSCGSAL